MGKYISDENYAQMLRDATFDHADEPEKLFGSMKHVLDLHSADRIKTGDIIARLYQTGALEGASAFQNDHEAASLVSAAIGEAADRICAWRYHLANLEDDEKQGFRGVFDVNVGEGAGVGYRSNLCEYKTPIVSLVLERAESNEQHPFGFVICTAYPNINVPEAAPTGLRLTKDDVINAELLHFGSHLDKIAFLVSTPQIRAKRDQYVDGVLWIHDKKREYSISVSKDKVNYYQNNERKREHVPCAEIAKHCPALIRAAQQAFESMQIGHMRNAQFDIGSDTIRLRTQNGGAIQDTYANFAKYVSFDRPTDEQVRLPDGDTIFLSRSEKAELCKMHNTALIVGEMQHALDLSGQARQEEDIVPEHAEWPYHDEEWHLEL